MVFDSAALRRRLVDVCIRLESRMALVRGAGVAYLQVNHIAIDISLRQDGRTLICDTHRPTRPHTRPANGMSHAQPVTAPAESSHHEIVLSSHTLPFPSSNAHSLSASPATYAPRPQQAAHLQNTFDSESDYSAEMDGDQDQEVINTSELPISVASSPFFTLPREIRDRIYTLCLTSHNHRQVEWPTQHRSDGLQPQLLCLCRIIHNETLPLLYAHNTFAFYHASDANMFVRAIASPTQSRHIANLTLNIKAHDLRLWMAYITSRDAHRSLKADFQDLRELNVRYRSVRWQHSLPLESNLKIWAEDSRLDEVIDAIRPVFLGSKRSTSRGRSGEGPSSTAASAAASSRQPFNPSDANYLLDARRMPGRVLPSTKQPSPTIRVTCICRVHSTHYNALTNPAHPAPPVRDLTRPGNGTGVIQQQSDDVFAPPTPVRGGEPFRGFTTVDFQGAGFTSAGVARTVFADREGVGLALEIQCADPRREVGV